MGVVIKRRYAGETRGAGRVVYSHRHLGRSSNPGPIGHRLWPDFSEKSQRGRNRGTPVPQMYTWEPLNVPNKDNREAEVLV